MSLYHINFLAYMPLMDNPKPTIPDWLYGSRIDNSTHGSYAEFFFMKTTAELAT